GKIEAFGGEIPRVGAEASGGAEGAEVIDAAAGGEFFGEGEAGADVIEIFLAGGEVVVEEIAPCADFRKHYFCGRESGAEFLNGGSLGNVKRCGHVGCGVAE